MMKILAIETSTKSFSLAVLDNDKVISERNAKLTNILSSSIIPAIDKILKKAKLSLDKLDGFVVGLGPGSFTSLRVGLSTIKGLAFVTQKPVVGVSSLDSIALNHKPKKDQDICVVRDAKRNLVYACLYELKSGALKQKTPYLLCTMDELLKKINKNTYFTGDGVKLFKEEIKKRARVNVSFADEKRWHPKARHLVYLAQKRFENKKFDNPDTLIPLYLYPDDCQVEK